jgi:hypothetical protein
LLGGTLIVLTFPLLVAERVMAGLVVGVQPSGLVMSWPRPIGQIARVPGVDRQIAQRITGTAPGPGLEDAYTKAAGQAISPDSASFLTGDGGVVLLQATLYYQVSDAISYMLT